MVSSMSEVTRILSEIELGESAAVEQLLPLVYDELRRLAIHRMAQEKPGNTLQATALVHEAYLRLVGSEAGQHKRGVSGWARVVRFSILGRSCPSALLCLPANGICLLLIKSAAVFIGLLFRILRARQACLAGMCMTLRSC
jgi:hypothetical protein